MKRSIIVWVHRPNQAHHCIFSVAAGIALASKGFIVKILICNNSSDYCVVKYQSGLTGESNQCSACDPGICMLSEIYAHLLQSIPSSLRHNISLEYTKDTFSAIHVSREKANQVYKSFQQWYAAGSPGNHIPNCDWLSEACSITGLTPFDFSKTDVIPEITSLIQYTLKHNALSRLYLTKTRDPSLLVYNGRFAAAKAWISEFRSKRLPFVVHETGYHKDSFTLNLGWSVEEHFLLKPKDFFPNVSEITSLASRLSRKDLIYTFIDYILPKLKGDKTYYQIDALSTHRSSETQSQPKIFDVREKITLLLLASSYDEVALPVPFDRTIFEQTFIKQLVSTVIENKYLPIERLYIRFHPRSFTNLADSRASKGIYAELLHSLYKYSSLCCNTEIIIIEPDDSRVEFTSYELIRRSSHAVSLFSITAIEAAAMGIPAIAHEFARGATILPNVLKGSDPRSAVEQLITWLSSGTLPDQKCLSRTFLGPYLKARYIYPRSFKYFSPMPNRNGSFLQHFLDYTSSTKWLEDVSWSYLESLFLDNDITSIDKD